MVHAEHAVHVLALLPACIKFRFTLRMGGSLAPIVCRAGATAFNLHHLGVPRLSDPHGAEQLPAGVVLLLGLWPSRRPDHVPTRNALAEGGRKRHRLKMTTLLIKWCIMSGGLQLMRTDIPRKSER